MARVTGPGRERDVSRCHYRVRTKYVYTVLDREQGRRNAMSCLVLCATQSSGRISVAVPVPESFTKHFLLVVVVLVAAAAFAVASI